MRLVTFNRGRVGAVVADGVVELSELVAAGPGSWPPVGMVQLIASFPELRAEIARRLEHQPPVPWSAVSLEAPVQWPNKLIAYPANYDAHIHEMHTTHVQHLSEKLMDDRADRSGFFLKANSSLIGPEDVIVLPPGDRVVHHEAELAVIIGRRGRRIPAAHALEHVFGYACLVDVTVRGHEERVMRKSWDTFCPLGPHLVTADEVPDPDQLRVRLSVNGEVRQDASTAQMILSVARQIEMASAAATLEPGDIIATGTPQGVGPLTEGDVVDIEIESVGAMTLRVTSEQFAAQPA